MADTTFTNLDFNDVKKDIVQYLSNQDRFKDFDFTGSNMSILLDVLAYNTVLNNFYTNMAFSEMFMDSAQLKESVVSHAKELNYLPGSKKGATAYINLEFDANNSPSSILIPRYTEFTGKANGKSYKFVTTESNVCKPNATGDYILSDLEIKEGKVITEFFTVSNDTPRFTISNENIDISTIRVIVRDSNDVDSDSAEYIKKSSIFGVSSNDNVFYLQPYLDNKYEIVFGNDVFGNQPENGNVIEVKYLVTAGEEANGISQFSRSTGISTYSVSVSLSQAAAGGAEEETIESIRFYAPKSIQIQERAVTRNDYEILLKNEFNEIQSVSVFGGEDDTPPRYGKVIVNIDTRSGFGLSEKNKEKYTDFLETRCPIGINPIIRPAKFMFVQVNSDVYYSTQESNKSGADIEQLVRDRITFFSNNNLNDFRKALRYSKLVKEIDEVDPSILSNDTRVWAIIEESPVSTTDITFDVTFNNRIAQRPEGGNVTSSTVVFENSLTYFRDNGQGVINLVKDTDGEVVIIKNAIGTIDYANGRIQIPKISLDSYTGSAIKMYAALENKDIIAPKDRIISIRQEDVVIDTINTEE